MGKFDIEKLTRIPVEIDIASEFRYRDPIITDKCLTVLISQSGETANTLVGLREAKGRGGKSVCIYNVVDSSIARESDGVIYAHAGPEIGVASTKALIWTALKVPYCQVDCLESPCPLRNNETLSRSTPT